MAGMIETPVHPTVIELPARRLAPAKQDSIRRSLATEIPVAIEIDGEPYAVMMLSPVDLEDFAAGFMLSERLVASASDIARIDIREATRGIAIDIRLFASAAARIADRRRTLPGQSSCGICGIMTLEEAMPELPPFSFCASLSRAALAEALAALPGEQDLNGKTGAVHAAAFCALDGAILAVREDVGRHNALDKIVGHLARTKRDPASGFALLTSRCSYELVQKTVLARIPLLVTISAPTGLAVSMAKDAKLTLIALARADSVLLFNDPFAIFPQ